MKKKRKKEILESLCNKFNVFILMNTIFRKSILPRYFSGSSSSRLRIICRSKIVPFGAGLASISIFWSMLSSSVVSSCSSSLLSCDMQKEREETRGNLIENQNAVKKQGHEKEISKEMHHSPFLAVG